MSKSSDKIRVLVVDDHPLIREGIRMIIDEHDDIEIAGEAADGKEAVKLARQISPDIILMDINMPVMGGIEATEKITKENPQIHIIALSFQDSQNIKQQMYDSGASNYVMKSKTVELLIPAIRSCSIPNDNNSFSSRIKSHINRIETIIPKIAPPF